MARMSDAERAGAVELLPADGDYGDGGPNPGDAAEQWGEFESFRDQAESERRGMLIWVYRIPTDAQGIPVTGGETSLLFTAPIDTYPSLPTIFNRVKKEYMPRGAGRALIRIQVRREKRQGVLWQKVFTIEKGTSDDEPEINQVKPANDMSEIARVIHQAMTAQAEQNRQLINAILARQNSAPAVDPLQQTERMIAMVSGLAGILVNKSAGPAVAGASVAEQLSGFREMMKFAREMGGEFGGGGDDEDPGALGVIKSLTPWAGVFEKLLAGMQANKALPAPAPAVQRQRVRRIPPSQDELAARAARTGGQPPGAHLNPPPNITTQPAPSFENHVHTSAPRTGEQEMLLKIVEMTNELITLKNGGADPSAIGKTIPGMLTPEIENRLLDLLDADDWFEKLAGFNPAVREHREFFAALRDAFLSEYETDGGEAGAGEPADS